LSIAGTPPAKAGGKYKENPAVEIVNGVADHPDEYQHETPLVQRNRPGQRTDVRRSPSRIGASPGTFYP
jgi:hypothetical protein